VKKPRSELLSGYIFSLIIYFYSKADMSNIKKVLIICGQTGVGKTDIAVSMAKKLTSEIIVLDNMQQYKQLNISNNKPLHYLNMIKFHNIDIADVYSPGYNAAQFSTRSMNVIKDLTSRNKIPVIEGGSGFYIKSLLTGNTHKRSEKDVGEYNKATQIARDIINYDKDFKATLQRLYKLDTSLPQFLIQDNDSYRLEKKLSDAILYGDGAYKFVKEKEDEKKKEAISEYEFYNFFLYMDKMNIYKTLEVRCEQMIKFGLIEEVVGLIKDGYLTNSSFSQIGSIYANAYGIEETIEFLKNLLRKYNNKEAYFQAFSPRASNKDVSLSQYRREAERMIYNYLYEFVTKNRQYAKKQAGWFRTQDNFVWKKVTNSSKDKLSDEIFSTLSNKEKYLTDLTQTNKDKNEINRTKDPKYLPQFTLLKDKKLILDFLKLSYSQLEEIKDKIPTFDLIAKKTESSKYENINLELIKKYLI
jgi:tRNA dimethylallyltransferase